MFGHTLTLLVAMMLSALAEPGSFKNRRQNYNSNANLNDIYGGFGSGLGTDHSRDRGGSYDSLPKYETVLGPVVASGKGRGGELYDSSPKYENVIRPVVASGKERGGGLYVSSPKYESVLGPILVSGKERGGGLLGLLKYNTRGSGTGGIGNENLSGGDNSYSRGSCEGLLESLFREDDKEATSEESRTYDDGSSEDLFDYNSNYNIAFKDNSRRYMNYRPYVGNDRPRRGSNANSNANSNILGSKYRRNYNWGTLRPTYGSFVNYDRNSRDYDRINSDYDRINQDYDKNSQFYDRNEQDYDRPSRNYDRGYRGTNMNANSNQNILGGRRSNINSNANNNEIRYGGHGQGRGNERYDRSPSYGYGKAGLDFDDDEAQESYGDYTTSRYPAMGYTPRPSYAGYRDNDDVVDDDEEYNPMQNDNINSNVNSNVNIMSRRNNINSNANSNLFSRYKRSVENPPQALESRD